jgi:hypothetical protein
LKARRENLRRVFVCPQTDFIWHVFVIYFNALQNCLLQVQFLGGKISIFSRVLPKVLGNGFAKALSSQPDSQSDIIELAKF